MNDQQIYPPQARRRPHPKTRHGDTRVDDYYWLRERDDPTVLAHLEAENAYTQTRLAPTEPLQETLYREMLARIQETDVDVPEKLDDYFYYSRTEAGQEYMRI